MCHWLSKAAAFGFVSLLVVCSTPASAQQPPVNGMRPADLRTHAITDATVITAPGEMLERATIVIRNGVIQAVGEDIDVPEGAWIWPGEGLTVYPGLIDAAVLVSVSGNPSGAGAHWNRRIHPQVNMADQPAPSASLRRELRRLGFTVGAFYGDSGVLRGSGVVLALADEDEHVLAYRDRAAMAAGFDYGGRWASANYPGSLMGAIALLRQTLYDAQWHAECRRVYDEDPNGTEPPIRADALVALYDVIQATQPVLFDCSDEHNALRAGRVATEFGIDMMLLGSGMEFRRLDNIVAMDMPIILPLRFPDRPNVSTLHLADRTTLREMMTWEQAPTNARRLIDAGATVALTTHRLDRRRAFPAALRSAIQHGLSEDDALAALTTTPARLLGIEQVAGTIEPGKVANLVVVDGNLFEQDAKIRDTWVNGRRYEISRDPDITFVGSGMLRTDEHELKIDLNTVRSRATIHVDEETKLRARNVTVQRDHVSLLVDGKALDVTGFVHLSGVISGGIVTGTGAMPDGRRFDFTIEPDEQPEAEEVEPDEEPAAPDDDNREAAPNEGGNGIGGTWSLTVRSDMYPEDIAVSLTITEHDDGSITGVSSVMDLESPIQNAIYDSATRKLRYDIDTPAGRMRVVATIDGDRMVGSTTGEGFAAEFSGTRRARAERRKQKGESTFEMPPDELVFPLGAYGLAQPPQRQDVLITNATIWTSGPQGIIERGWMLVQDGVIAGIGRGDAPEEHHGAVDVVIDATGRHITPGLIDCHSHTGITGGVNEWTQVNTAEVRIADVINPDDVNWYRQLAGGLTAANQLHGSANPIGGQNSVVKLKWGALGGADDMLIDDAAPGIKFALGENVVRTQTRYPNTRMGVETVLRDAFTAAREYNERRNNSDTPVRRELDLDALAEILEGERLVHCHSYRQDEILMLIRVAEDFGFTVGTFQHVLEGYKVAEAIAAHGAGASAFSDWWGFKVEVMDAIPHAGALMHEVGVNVSFNSDSSELARRMNTEAAKAVRYGGVEPAEALKFVTINPAMQLAIDHRTGSLEVGKDADFVIWSGDPMSTYTRTEQTWIEGVRYFDIDTDRELREQIDAERRRLIQKILTQAHGEPDARKNDEPKAEDDTAVEPAEPNRLVRGESRLMQRLMENRRRAMAEMYRLGQDPEEIRPGECGCNDWWYQLR